MLASEDRTGDLLPLDVDLSFTSEQWKRTILVRTPHGARLARRHFEVCVFTALAATLKSGDVAVDGSDAYADYRQQLLPWTECEPQVVEYCNQVGLATIAGTFVHQLKSWLSETAARVDTGFPSNGDLAIADNGEPV
ncbi:MAG: Tn3 family transposase, partial [Chloroflexi bacterium]|nr:Tn3 family transposase [Chloroflexota bacterium]